MTELTREDLYQINEALKTAIKALQNRVGRVAEAEMKELKDAFQLIDAALYPMPAAPEKPAAKAVKLTSAQRDTLEAAQRLGAIGITKMYSSSGTLTTLRKRGLLDSKRYSGGWRYFITDAGREALANS